MVSHIKMQQFFFITIYINETYGLEIISHLYNQVLFLVIVGKDGRLMIECQNAFALIRCCALCGG